MDINNVGLSPVGENGETRTYESRFESMKVLNSKLNNEFLMEFAEKFIGGAFDCKHTIDVIMIRLLDYKHGCKSRPKAYQNEVKEVYRYIVEWRA